MSGNSTQSINGSFKVVAPGITSMAFHVPLVILVVTGILGNTVALVWNCCRKESRRSLLTVLVSSLAVAEIFFCLQLLLQEAIVVQAIAMGRETFVTFTEPDKGIFLSVTFFLYTSCNAIMATTVAISVYSYLALRGGHRNVFTVAFVVIGWMASIGVAVSAMMDFRDYFAMLPGAVSLDFFVNVMMFGHMAACVHVDNATLYPMIVTSFNAIASVVCTVFYISVWRRIRKKLFGRDESTDQDIRQIHIRLFIIVVMNMLCWWPVCIVFLYVYITKNSVWNRGPPVEVTIPIFFVIAAACAANPIIYTITSKPFIKTTIRACVLVCNRRKWFVMDGLRIRTSYEKLRCSCTYSCCGKTKGGKRISYTDVSDVTEETHLFTETTE